MIQWTLVSLLAYNFPTYFNAEQKLNAAIIIDKSLAVNEDPHFMVALAWVESRVKVGKVSRTGDYGIFQVNYRFWAKKWGYSDKQKFLVDMSSAAHATVAATTVLREMRKYKTCRGLNLAACYNGGPGWQKSKNKEKILSYANKVNRMRGIFKRKFPKWVLR
tara:strand:+ start:59 stop:544 length:486 start_codon:yes stop_codon:yes gene_type:complete